MKSGVRTGFLIWIGAFTLMAMTISVLLMSLLAENVHGSTFIIVAAVVAVIVVMFTMKLDKKVKDPSRRVFR